MKSWFVSTGHDKLKFNWRHLEIAGWWLTIIPLCELVFNRLFSELSSSWQFQVHKILYVILIGFSYRLWGRSSAGVAGEPLMQPLLEFNGLFWQTFALLTGALVFCQQSELILPCTYIWAGISFYLWGQLLIPRLRLVGFVYITCGLLMVIVNSRSGGQWWRVEIVVFGISYIILARWSRRQLEPK